MTTSTLPNAPPARMFYSAIIKDNFIYYIGGADINHPASDMTETARNNSITARYGHSTVLYGLIILYGGQTVSGLQAQPDVALLNVNVSPYVWTAIKDKAPQVLAFHSAIIYQRYMIVAFGMVIPQPISQSSAFKFNNNLYILNTQNYTWINYFDAPNVSESNLDNNSLSLGAKIGICIAVVVALVVMGAAEFFIYKKFRVRNNCRNSIATSGTS
ncbi:43319_t:CDS:2, partial [Gigaspora margarita]